MGEHEENRHDGHSGMNHGIGMMLGCMVPLAAIVLLPRIGVSPVAALIVGFVGMFALHGGMTMLRRLKGRRAGRAVEQAGEIHSH